MDFLVFWKVVVSCCFAIWFEEEKLFQILVTCFRLFSSSRFISSYFLSVELGLESSGHIQRYSHRRPFIRKEQGKRWLFILFFEWTMDHFNLSCWQFLLTMLLLLFNFVFAEKGFKLFYHYVHTFGLKSIYYVIYLEQT